MLAWGIDQNLENSLHYFLTSQISTSNVTDINGNLIPVRIGYRSDNDWTLPCIVINVESTSITKPFIGSNFLDDRQLIIINIFATTEGERADIANWITQTIKDGFRYYSYSPNPSNPDNPTKVAGTLVIVDSFLTNGRVKLGQDVSDKDAHRHQITINVLVPNA